MTYDEFTAFCIAFAWREGDLDLEGKIDDIIKMANAELRRTLKTKEREMSLTVDLEDNVYQLNDDVHSVKHVITYLGEHGKISMGERATMIADLGDNTTPRPVYTQVGKKLYLVGAFKAAFEAGNPVPMTLVYNTKIPDFKATDESWLTSENLNLYVYMVMKHACTYLREDERLPVWVQLVGQALEDANDDDAWSREEGQQYDLPLQHLT